MTTPETTALTYGALMEMAAEHDRQALHNYNESLKIRRWRDKRLAMLREQAGHSIATRPTTIHDAESIVWAWASNDPKLKEYGAGIEITERRAAMHAAMATNFRSQAQSMAAHTY